MVFFSSIELLCWQNLCNNLPVQDLLLSLFRLHCCLFLLWCVEVYSWSVLCPNIITLPIKRGGIMASPERIKQILVIALFWIILNPNDLRVVRSTWADIVIRRVIQISLTISYLRFGHSRNPLKSQFDAPKATSSELCELLTWSWDVVIWSLRYCWRSWIHGGLCRLGTTKPELS